MRGSEAAVRTLSSADELGGDWDQLATSLDAPVFHGRAFIRAYEHHPVQRISSPRYLEVRGPGDDLLAAAPAYLQGDPLGLLGLADGEQGLLSPVWHSPDSRVLAVNDAALDALQGAFAAEAEALGCPLWGFVNVNAGSPMVPRLIQRGFHCRELVPRWVLTRQLAPDGQAYLTGLSKSARQELRRQRRRAAEHGISTLVHHGDIPDLERMLELVAATAARAGSPKYYHPQRFASFLTELGEPVRVLELRDSGSKTIAVGICLVEDTRLQFWAAGYLRDRTDLAFSPFYVLWWEVLELMWSLGVQTAECGRLNETFKRRMGMLPWPLVALLGPQR